MKKFKLRKKSGEFRTIYAPSYQEKWHLRLICVGLNERVTAECNHNIVHGFIRGHSPVTNALAHINKKYTLSMDLKDFFDSVNMEKINSSVSNGDNIVWTPWNCLVDGAARQGLPTSPALSNLACIKMDKQILEICQPNIIYTRYADDLSFSGDDSVELKQLSDQVQKIIEQTGFQVNQKKKRIQSAQYGRRNITGVSVDTGIHPTRKIKRRLRAALHRGNLKEAKGLKEWCLLKTPNPNGGCNITKVQKVQAKKFALDLIQRGK